MSARPDIRIDAEAAAARHAELTEILDRANRLYHQEDAPELANAEYDALFRELVELEEAVPALQTPDSPTQRVGAGPIASTFDEVRHRRPMLSLSNALSHDELRAFDARVRKGLGLISMTERLRILAGDISIRSQPDKGTVVEVTVPLPKSKKLEAPIFTPVKEITNATP